MCERKNEHPLKHPHTHTHVLWWSQCPVSLPPNLGLLPLPLLVGRLLPLPLQHLHLLHLPHRLPLLRVRVALVLLAVLPLGLGLG